MAIQAIHGANFRWPMRVPEISLVRTTLQMMGTVDYSMAISTDYIQFIGTLEWSDGYSGLKTVDEILVLIGSVTTNLTAGSSALQASIQAPTTTDRRGDGTTLRVGSRTTDLTPNTLNGVAMSSGSSQFKTSDVIVVDFRFSSFVSASFNIQSCWTNIAISDPVGYRPTSLRNTAPVVLLRSGSTYGILRGGTVFQSFGPILFDSTDTFDELGTCYIAPFTFKFNGIWGGFGLDSSSATMKVRVVKNPFTSPVDIVTRTGVGAALIGPQNGAARYGQIPFDAEYTINAGDVVAITAVAETTTPVVLYEVNMGNTNIALGSALPGGSDVGAVYRANETGVYTVDYDLWHVLGFNISGASDDIGAGASGIKVHPGMTGGMRG